MEAYSYDGKPGAYPLDSITVLDWRFGHLCILTEDGIDGINVMYLLDVASVSIARKSAMKSRRDYNSPQLFIDPWKKKYTDIDVESVAALERRGFQIRKPLQPIVWMSIGVVKWGEFWEVERSDGLRQFRSLSQSIKSAEQNKKRLNQNPACQRREDKTECWTEELERVLKLERSLMRKPWSVVPAK